MELKRIVILISLVLNEISRTSGIHIMIGNIQVFKKHHKLRECAASTLPKTLVEDRYVHDNLYIGGRISTSEGKCEALSRHQISIRDEAVQNAYSYFKFVGVKEVFNPPIRSHFFERIFPVTLLAGVKVTVTFREEVPSWKLLIFLGDRDRGDRNAFIYKNSEKSFILTTNPETQRTEIQVLVDTSKIVELSFWVETNAIEVHVNGLKIGMFPAIRLSDVDTFELGHNLGDQNGLPFIIHSFSVA